MNEIRVLVYRKMGDAMEIRPLIRFGKSELWAILGSFRFFCPEQAENVVGN